MKPEEGASAALGNVIIFLINSLLICVLLMFFVSWKWSIEQISCTSLFALNAITLYLIEVKRPNVDSWNKINAALSCQESVVWNSVNRKEVLRIILLKTINSNCILSWISLVPVLNIRPT